MINEDEFYKNNDIIYGIYKKENNNIVFESKLNDNRSIKYNPFVIVKMVRKGLFITIGGNYIS